VAERSFAPGGKRSCRRPPRPSARGSYA